MSWGKLLGTYTVVNGGLYLLNGGFGAVFTVQLSIAGPIIGMAIALVGLLMMMAGGGIMMERDWARYVGAVVLGFDVLEKALLLVVMGSVIDAVFGLLSAASVAMLLFGDPFEEPPGTDLDEDGSVHDIGSLQR